MKVLDQETRRLILQLHERGVARRRIARLVGHSRPAVSRVIADGNEEPVMAGRGSKLDEHRADIEKLIGQCRGNLLRVHEELVDSGVKTAYTTLTDYVRKHNLKKPPPVPAGRYHFDPGQEMQFDTSSHRVTFKDGERKWQCASLVMCYSRVWYFQYYPRFRRLECKSFLTDALKYFEGACKDCMIDNTNLVVLHGTGDNAVIVPEMVDFGERYGFKFIAHTIGDANRSGRVERRFHHAENNFLAGRTFADAEDLNRRAVEFCDRVNRKPQRRIDGTPMDRYPADQAAMSPLPPVVPEVYQVAHRIVDVEGYIHLAGNTYSVPYKLIGRQVEIRENLAQLRVYHGPREVAVHPRALTKRGHRTTDQKHRPKRSTAGRRSEQPIPEERHLRGADPLLDGYLDKLVKKAPGRGAATVRRLYRMYNEYPQEAFLAAVGEADKYNMVDLSRLEKMVLKALAGRLFPQDHLDHQEDDHE